MEREPGIAAPKNRPLTTRIHDWLDARTGIKSLTKKVLDEPIPGGARFAYVFGSGLLFIFLLQAITGVSLALYYTPTAETAHTSVAYISKQVEGGAFLRSLHSYGSSAMIIVLGLHFIQTFFYGSFKGRRELLWISGAVLSFLVLGMGFTGYLLPWDQKAYFATAVGTNVAGQTPFIGNMLTRMMRGGDTIGTLTLSRFYVAHVFLIPATIFAFIGAHIFLFRKAGPAGPAKEDPITPKLATETFYPRQVFLDMGFVLLIMAVLSGLSYFHPATLGPIANPSDTHFLPRPEWYYLPMFEWLKFWEGPRVVIGIVVIPGLLAMAFFLMPFLDRRLERLPWRRPIPTLAVALVVAGMVFLGVKSQFDDREGPIAEQLALQREQERAYSAAPFQPYIESPNGFVEEAALAGPMNPLVAVGKGIFNKRGCIGCHGVTGMGTIAAPSLMGVTHKYGEETLVGLLRNPNARMRAGRMPEVDISSSDMSALLAYLQAIGSRAASVPAVYPAPSPPSSAGGSQPLAVAAKVSLITGAPRGGQEGLSGAAAAGQQIFQERGCFACHGPAGTGGRAPALAPLVAKLSDAQLADVLQKPNSKMLAGGMPPVDVSKEDIQMLISYLRSLPMPKPGEQPVAKIINREVTPIPEDRTRSPDTSIAQEPHIPVPVVESSGPAANASAATVQSAGRKLFVAQGCVGCHGFTAQGTKIAPSLIGVASRFPGDKLPALLHNPTSKMKGGGMPTIAVSDAQMADLVAYLSSLKEAPAPAPAMQSDMASASAATQPAPYRAVASQIAHSPETSSPKLTPLAMRGRQVFERNACSTCHGIEGLNGTVAAPGLAGTASLLPASTLESLLRHHSARMQKGGMPPTDFGAQDMKAIVAYILAMTPPPAEGGKLIALDTGKEKN